MEPKLKAWWEKLMQDKDKQADIIFDFLDSVGYDGRMKVGKEREIKKTKQRYDWGEEWRSWGKQWHEDYNAIVGDHEEKVRYFTLLHTNGYTTKEEWAKAKTEVRSKMDMVLMMSMKKDEYEAVPYDRKLLEELERKEYDGLQYGRVDTEGVRAAATRASGQIAFPWQ